MPLTAKPADTASTFERQSRIRTHTWTLAETKSHISIQSRDYLDTMRCKVFAGERVAREGEADCCSHIADRATTSSPPVARGGSRTWFHVVRRRRAQGESFYHEESSAVVCTGRQGRDKLLGRMRRPGQKRPRRLAGDRCARLLSCRCIPNRSSFPRLAQARRLSVRSRSASLETSARPDLLMRHPRTTSPLTRLADTMCA